MIAGDTCSLIAFLSGDNSADALNIKSALLESRLVVPSVIITEILSDPLARDVITEFVRELPVLELYDGYWVRAANIRQVLLSNGLKAKLGDALTAQSCIDHNIPLITRDKDFRHYVTYCGLKLYES